ncbi:hypothetical protein SPURM210S_07378 [Streptomyces purpurascens]
MAVGVLGGGDGGLPVVLPAHVEMDVPGADLLREGLALVVQDVRDDDPRPLGPEQPGLLLALAARGAGDDDDPSVELARGLTHERCGHVDTLPDASSCGFGGCPWSYLTTHQTRAGGSRGVS